MKTRYFLYLGLLIAVLMMTACGSKATPEPTATPTPLPPTDTPVPRATKAKPAAGGAEIPMGFTAEGLPYRGNPDAPVTLWEYSDFQ
ncbi:MAG: hypothetical protein QHJ81_12305 [Anaerolineae bacterium]|nr:hypothetical protein [Anaerolineae bacterium]